MIFSKAQQIIMTCGCREYTIPRGRGATTACVYGALNYIDQNHDVQVLVLVNRLDGIENVISKYLSINHDLYTWRRNSDGYANILKSNVTNSIIEFKRFKPCESIVSINQIYNRIYIDNIEISDNDKLVLPCIVSDNYCIILSKELS